MMTQGCMTKSRNARSEQLLMMPTQLLTDREWLQEYASNVQWTDIHLLGEAL